VTDYYDPNRPSADEPFDPYEGLLDLSGGEPIPPLEDPRLPPAAPPRSPLLTGLILGLLLVVLSIALFQLARDDDEDTTGSAAPTSTVASETGSSVADGESTTTNGAGTTPTSPALLSTTPYEASGDPIPVKDLTLQVDGIGAIKLGTSAAESIGRLIASLGEPDSDSGQVTSTGEFGACVGDMERIVTWGPLAAVVLIDDDGTATFAGYRVDWTYADPGELAESPANNLTTLSGVRVGESVRILQSVYSGFSIDFVRDPQVGMTFELRGANSDTLLLWGPVTQDTEAGIITGIYSPDACDRFSLNR